MLSIVRIFIVTLGAASMLCNAAATACAEPLDAASLTELQHLYKQLIDAENAHDVKAVAPFVWDSPSTLFVAKTSDPSQGNWQVFGARMSCCVISVLYMQARFIWLPTMRRSGWSASPKTLPRPMFRCRFRFRTLARTPCRNLSS